MLCTSHYLHLLRMCQKFTFKIWCTQNMLKLHNHTHILQKNYNLFLSRDLQMKTIKISVYQTLPKWCTFPSKRTSRPDFSSTEPSVFFFSLSFIYEILLLQLFNVLIYVCQTIQRSASHPPLSTDLMQTYCHTSLLFFNTSKTLIIFVFIHVIIKCYMSPSFLNNAFAIFFNPWL